MTFTDEITKTREKGHTTIKWHYVENFLIVFLIKRHVVDVNDQERKRLCGTVSRLFVFPLRIDRALFV